MQTTRLALPIVLAFSMLLGGCANYTTVRQHKELPQESQNIGSVVILPPEVAIQLITFTGENEQETARQDATAKALSDEAKSALAARGLHVVDFDFAKAAETHPELAFALTQCSDALKTADKTLYGKTLVDAKDMGTFSENIGAAANTIAELSGADALLLINYQGFEKSTGMVAKDIIAGALLGVLTGQAQVAPSQGASIELALIAANSGNVLWVNRKAAPALNTAVHATAMLEFPKVQWRQQPTAIAEAPQAQAEMPAATEAAPAAIGASDSSPAVAP